MKRIQLAGSVRFFVSTKLSIVWECIYFFYCEILTIENNLEFQ